jgi:hypothetical protein
LAASRHPLERDCKVLNKAAVKKYWGGQVELKNIVA